KVEYRKDPTFGLAVPEKCPDVPNAILNPRDTWRNEEEYDKAAAALAKRFEQNFEKYADQTADAIVKAGPVVMA
ncbi:MAG: phosphoenolpyruvate carboxykinase (ATP), partial [Bacteroidota bacterium]